MWAFVFLIALIIVGFFVSFFIYFMKDSKRVEENKDKLYKNISEIPYTKEYIDDDGKKALLLDEYNKDFYIYKHGCTEKINYKDILQAEVVEDSQAVTQTVRSSQIAGTIIGSLALGGIGAAIGGLSGKKEHNDKVRKIDLRIIVNDTTQPIRKFQFIDFVNAKDTKDDLYKKFYDDAFEWYQTLEVLMHQADKEDQKQESTAN